MGWKCECKCFFVFKVDYQPQTKRIKRIYNGLNIFQPVRARLTSKVATVNTWSWYKADDTSLDDTPLRLSLSVFSSMYPLSLWVHACVAIVTEALSCSGHVQRLEYLVQGRIVTIARKCLGLWQLHAMTGSRTPQEFPSPLPAGDKVPAVGPRQSISKASRAD